MYKYEFTSAIRDLLDAEEADATRTTDLRRSLRWAVALLCGALGLASLSALRLPGYSWQPFIPFLLCCYGVYYFVVAGYVRGRRICRGNDPSREVRVEFRDDCLELAVSDYGTYRRDWHELLLFTDAARGVLLYFDDGTVNWLPDRVFRDRTEKKELIEFLKSQSARSSGTFDIEDN